MIKTRFEVWLIVALFANVLAYGLLNQPDNLNGKYLSRAWGNLGTAYWNSGQKQKAYEAWMVAYHLDYWPNDNTGQNRALHLRNLAIAEFHIPGCQTFKRLQEAIDTYPPIKKSIKEGLESWYELYPDKFEECKDEVMLWE